MCPMEDILPATRESLMSDAYKTTLYKHEYYCMKELCIGKTTKSVKNSHVCLVKIRFCLCYWYTAEEGVAQLVEQRRLIET